MACALTRELGAELPRHGRHQARRHRQYPPPQAREVSWTVPPAPGRGLAPCQRPRPGPASAQTEAGPTSIPEKATSPSPSSAAAHRSSAWDAAPTTDQAPTRAAVSCSNPFPKRVATQVAPSPWIEGDRRDAGLHRARPADRRDAGLHRARPADRQDAGPPHAALAGRSQAGWPAV